MQKLTQTRPDNCWQTAVAVLLGCPAESLPAQQKYLGDRMNYAKALRACLDKHHGKTYVEADPKTVPMSQFPHHLMIGETVRTTAENPVWHAVVGSFGQQVWDVHPSRAGLTKIILCGFVVPTPQEWRKEMEKCVCFRCAA